MKETDFGVLSAEFLFALAANTRACMKFAVLPESERRKIAREALSVPAAELAEYVKEI